MTGCRSWERKKMQLFNRSESYKQEKKITETGVKELNRNKIEEKARRPISVYLMIEQRKNRRRKIKKEKIQERKRGEWKA